MPTQNEDLDALLRSDEATPDLSQDPEQIQGDQPKVSLEEQEFNKLTGSTQDRIRSLIKRAKTAETERDQFKSTIGTKLPPPPPQEFTPDVKQAVSKLEEVGIASKDYVRNELQQLVGQMQNENELRRLSEVESGENGRPKFDRYEYQDFVNTHPQYRYYQPADVFSIMYRDELIDWEVKNSSGRSTSTSSSLRNTKTLGKDDIWTPEYIEQMISEKGVDWYEKNLEKINKVLDSQR